MRQKPNNGLTESTICPKVLESQFVKPKNGQLKHEAMHLMHSGHAIVYALFS